MLKSVCAILAAQAEVLQRRPGGPQARSQGGHTPVSWCLLDSSLPQTVAWSGGSLGQWFSTLVAHSLRLQTLRRTGL